MDALILKPYWGKAILYGKDWEIRSRDTKKRGPVAIVTSGDHKVLGFTCITDTFKLTPELFNNNRKRHMVKTASFDLLPENYRNGYVYQFTDTVEILWSVYYRPKPGAVVWLNNIEDCVQNDKAKFLRISKEYISRHKEDT